MSRKGVTSSHCSRIRVIKPAVYSILAWAITHVKGALPFSLEQILILSECVKKMLHYTENLMNTIFNSNFCSVLRSLKDKLKPYRAYWKIQKVELNYWNWWSFSYAVFVSTSFSVLTPPWTQVILQPTQETGYNTLRTDIRKNSNNPKQVLQQVCVIW